jgi:cyclic-di-GMP phosphodiesterase TipF (flagellum assembly factor)
VVSANSAGVDRIQAVVGEINELGSLVKQLAATLETHEDMLAAGAASAAPPPVAKPESDPPSPLSADDKSIVLSPAAIVPKAVTGDAAPSRSHAQILAAVRGAVEENRIDIYLQPMVSLPQRKVRFYEAVTRLRDEKDQILAAEDFIGTAEAAGLIGRIDHMVMLRCVQVLRRLMVRNKEVGVFCNVAGATLGNTVTFAQCLDFLEANRALAPSFVLEFKQATFRNLGATETEHLAALAQRGYRFSIDHVTDLRIEPRELADRGVRYIKVPAALLLDPKQTSTSDIHPSDLSDLLGRFGIDLIAERIEGERAVVDLLDYDVRFGQGFLFAPPRPLRPEGASANGGTPSNRNAESNTQESKIQESAAQESQGTNGSVKTATVEAATIDLPARASGNAALARRLAGPG